MRFSIIIPVYNVEKYLRDCLDSVLGQSFSDWEAICVNDGSTDHSASILEEYASRDIRITVISQPNGGLSAARNTGMNAAKGDYVIFLDSDDWLEADALKTYSALTEDVFLKILDNTKKRTIFFPKHIKQGGITTLTTHYLTGALLLYALFCDATKERTF